MKTIVIITGIIILLLAIISARNILMNDFNLQTENTNNPNNIIKNNGNANTDTNSNLNNNNQEFGFQKVKLIVNSNGNYELSPSVLKKDVPVKMEVDLNSVYGCARSIVIKDFNVFKNVRQSDNIIEFTPNKEGRIRIQCSMNMYSGYFDVVSDGSKINELKTEEYVKNNLNTNNNELNKNTNLEQNTKIGCGCGGRL